MSQEPQTSKPRLRFAALGGSVALYGLSLVCMARPGLLASRISPPGNTAEWAAAAEQVIRCHAFVFLGLGGLCMSLVGALPPSKPRAHFLRALSYAVGAFVMLCVCLWDWIIDDAAITFAYAENLVRGHGLVLYPGYPPEEAYSNTLWLLLLAGFRTLGFAIPTTAKVLGILAGALSIVGAFAIAAKLLDARRFAQLAPLLMVILVQAPFVIWSGSGLEHSLQALGYITVLACAVWRPENRLWPALTLSALILVRPEVPLAVAAVWAAHTWTQLEASPRIDMRGLLSSWSIAVLPALCLVALIAFRLWYFGDPLPNPFYAKADDATFARVVNVLGGGWSYVLGWATATGMLCLLPAMALLPSDTDRLPIRVAGALVIAHVVFVIYAGGDWMGCFRFMAAVVPLLGVLVVVALGTLTRRTGLLAACATAIVLVLSLKALVAFRAEPTTPTAVVAKIADRFVAVADKLGVDDPLLAHHDAGGPSYLAKIKLLDLGGLGDRAVAKHWHDAEFMRRYMFVDKRPTFIFGRINFAALHSRFHEAPEFAAQYVPIHFDGAPYMSSDLSHVRRDLVRDAPGLHVERDDGGNVRAVHVRP